MSGSTLKVVDDILVTRPSTKPEILVDTLEHEEEVIEDNVHEIEEDRNLQRGGRQFYIHNYGVARHHSVIATRC